MENMLVVVDMVNGFINFGALADKDIAKIIPNVEKSINIAKQEKMKIVAFRDCHHDGDEEFKTYPPHCLDGTDESEIVPELKPYEKDMFVIKKDTTNGFKTESFLQLVTKKDYDNVYVVGCCTDICVQDFVLSYQSFIKQNQKQTKIKVIDDACATFGGANHDAKESHINSIQKMKQAGAEIVDIKSMEKEQLCNQNSRIC